MGFVEGRGVAVECRWAKGHSSELPSLAADLLGRPLALIAATGDPAAKAAKAAGLAVPLVFLVGQDPVGSGLVDSMNRPGKATGVNFFTGDSAVSGWSLSARWCRRRAASGCCSIRGSERTGRSSPAGGPNAWSRGSRAVGSNRCRNRGSFAALVKAGANGLVVQNDPFLNSRRSLIVALSSRHRLPGIFHIREFPADGGLMSYGASLVRYLPPDRGVCRQESAGRQDGRSSGPATHQVRNGDQRADRKGTRPCRATIPFSSRLTS